jgi:hypothetical protein
VYPPSHTTERSNNLKRLYAERKVQTWRAIKSHCYPVIADRVQGFAAALGSGANQQAVDVIAALRQLYYDVAGAPLPRALPALLNLVEADHLLYGSDFPFTPAATVEVLALMLRETPVLNEEQRQQMLYRNASRLFPRLDTGHVGYQINYLREKRKVSPGAHYRLLWSSPTAPLDLAFRPRAARLESCITHSAEQGQYTRARAVHAGSITPPLRFHYASSLSFS